MTPGFTRPRWAWCALAAIVVSSPRSSRADPPSTASEAHINRGIELRKLGRDADALVEFQRAYALSPTPRARAQVALALQALGDWVGAERGLEDALGAAGEPWVELYRGALEGALATVRSHLAWLWVDANVPSGELVLDGVLVHSIPLDKPIRVVVGALDIEVRASGYDPQRRSIEVAPGTELRESFSLKPVVSLSEPQPLASPLASPFAAAPSLPVSPAERSRRMGGYVGLGSAVAFAGGGIAAWRVREDQVAIYNDDSRCRFGPLTRDQRCGGNSQAADVALGLEIGAFAVSAVGAAVGVWLLWKPERRAPSAAAAWCAPSSTLGVACRGIF